VAESAASGRSNAVAVPAGTAGAEVNLTLGPTGGLEGRITRNGRAFPDTVVIASPHLGKMNYFVTSGEDGHYALDRLATGSYRLVVFLNRNKDQMYRTVAVETGRRGHAEFDLRTGDITLSVRAESDGPKAGELRVGVGSGKWAVVDSDTFESVMDRSAEDGAQEGTLYFRETRGAATRFEELVPGTYTVCVGRRQKAAPIRCLSKELTASAEVTLRAPK
jgi:hypothetical protein